MAETKMPEKPKLRKVIKNDISIRKKTRKEKLIEAFVAQDFKSAAAFAFEKYAIPTAKNLVVGFIFTTLNAFFYDNENANFVNPAAFGSNKTPYGGMFKGVNQSNNSTPKKPNSLPEYNDILFNAGEAEEVLQVLAQRAEYYGWVSYAEFYDALGKTSDFTKQNVGWTYDVIKKARVMYAGFQDGAQKYTIVMDRPRPYAG